MNNGSEDGTQNTAGIYVDNATRTILSGNRCGNSDSITVQDFGIQLTNTAMQALVTNNILLGNSQAATVPEDIGADLATGHIEANNMM